MTLAADDLLVTLVTLLTFALLAWRLPVDLTSNDPAHENDMLAVLFLPVLGVIPAGLFWMLSIGGWTPGARLSGCRLVPRPPRSTAELLMLYAVLLAAPPSVAFGSLWFVIPPQLRVPVALGLVVVIIAGSLMVYGRSATANVPMCIEDMTGGSFQSR